MKWMSRSTASRALTCVAIALIVLLMGACDRPSDLVIESGDFASWIEISNTFAEQQSSDTRVHGVLFQIADYDESPEGVFYRVELLDDTGEVVELLDDTGEVEKLDRSSFFWINIVSEPSAQVAPMQVDDVFKLYPNEKQFEVDPCPPDLENPCLRNRKLHASTTKILGLITYWQGAGGYRVTAKPPGSSPDPTESNQFEFWFEDPFTVEIYRINGTQVKSLALGEGVKIGRIIVKKDPAPPPDNGDKEDPPWPTPTP
jgi:hypothetical protein